MKRIFSAVLVVAALAATVTANTAGTRQRQDIASMVDGAVTVSPNVRANSAATGTWIDIGNYQGAMMLIATGQVDAAHYVVLQDSNAGAALATVDSIQIAAANDTTYLELAYRGRKRFVRALQRASGNGADSTYSGIVILRSGLRAR